MYTGTLQAVSNREDWSQAVALADAETGDAVTISRAALWVCQENEPNSPVLQGSTDDGKLALTADGFEISFTVSDLSAVSAGMYDLFVRIELDTGQIVQLMAGQIPFVEGGPTW